MPSVYNFSEHEMLAFFLVLLRISSFLVAWPVLGATVVPRPVKILFSLSISLIVFPTIDHSLIVTDINSMQVIWLFMREVFIGVSMGLLIHFFFSIFNIAGDIISVSLGLSQAQLFNPALGGKLSAFEQLLVILATLFFLTIGGHHLFLMGLVDSFSLIPLSDATLSLQGLASIAPFLQELMEMGIKVAAPVMLAILFTNLAMAIIGKAVPQINVLVTSLPVNILAGLLIFIFALPMVLMQVDGILELTTNHLFDILRTY